MQHYLLTCINKTLYLLLLLDKQYPTQGNWAHVRYATRAEKERAMALNGRQIIPGIMVGVVECREPPRMAMTNPGISSPERYIYLIYPLQRIFLIELCCSLVITYMIGIFKLVSLNIKIFCLKKTLPVLSR